MNELQIKLFLHNRTGNKNETIMNRSKNKNKNRMNPIILLKINYKKHCKKLAIISDKMNRKK